MMVGWPDQVTRPAPDLRFDGGEVGSEKCPLVMSCMERRAAPVVRADLGETRARAAAAATAVAGEEAVLVRVGREAASCSTSSMLRCSQPCCTLAIA